MTEILLISLIILAIINIVVVLRKKVKVDVRSQLNDFEDRIKNELQRNRTELSDLSEKNRKEMSGSIGVLEKKLTESSDKTNILLDQKFNQQNESQHKFNKQVSDEIKDSRSELAKSLSSFEDKFSQNIESLNKLLKEKFSDFSLRQTQANKQSTENTKSIETTIEKQLKDIRADNNKQLTEMRTTVDEKLQTTLEKRLGESFKQVSERLEMVHKGLGEMQTIATGVGDLKKVLSNVKTRGTLGEYQLEAILEQILSPEQYSKNVATKKGSQANVEFAIKLPGNESDKEVWVPIDSKFPMEDYNRLLDAFDIGDKIQIEALQKSLIKAIEGFAKDISQKYIDPPHTTDFAIMFLPVEGIYAEVLRHPQLFETLQNKYKITVTGPTTLSAFLSSLQMGFRTLAVQKRSSEVWDVLKAVKSEFNTFSGVFDKVQKQLNTASGTLETLRTTRTNVMERKLKDVESLTSDVPDKILEYSSAEIETKSSNNAINSDS
ncbi:MAG: DNA recombination protein RmuC [Methylococcales symbiont of Hymedesmia sp. n. MRB-2018]|nr:MAG: DNA recombination protein RmuC [Methylococcales symbiont of Hymedesmia sp. n. MRB-2018]